MAITRDAIGEALRCKRCGGKRAILAMGFRGHGNGTRGGRDYNARAFEAVTPTTHCVCMGGPVWRRLRELVSDEERDCLDKAYRDWEREGSPEAAVFVMIKDDQGGYEEVALTLDAWREYLIAEWSNLTDARAAA